MMVRLGDVCTVVSGTTPKTSVAAYWDGDINWITPAELKEDTVVIYESKRKITEAGVRASGLSSFPAGTVILSSRAPIGKVAIAGTEMYCNQGFKNLICSERIFNKYLFWFLKCNAELLNSLGRGATFKEISKSIVENIEIPLPDLPTQRRIAATLDKVSEGIELCRKMMADLDVMVKSRFVEMFGDLSSPKCQWEKCHLVEACADKDDIKCGPFGTQLNKDEYLSEGVAVWEIPQINSGFMKKPTHFLTEQKAEQLSAYSLVSGDIAMSRKGNVGKCAIFPEIFAPGIIHSDVLRIRIDSAKVNPVFMMSQLHYSGAVTQQIETVSSGAIMAGINVTKLKQIIVHIPPYALQNRFAAFVAEVDKSKFNLQQQLTELETLKKSLMQQYFGQESGQKDAE